MKTTARFEAAVIKLYTAFHSNTLNPECCKQCAVGNILNQTAQWKHLSDEHGSLNLNYIGLVNQRFGRRFSGYTPLELLQIEHAFLKGCGYQLPLNHKNSKPEHATNPDNLFKGLSYVVEVLCKLDNLPNVMDCSKMFNYNAEHLTSSIK